MRETIESTDAARWLDANHRALCNAIAQVRATLERYIEGGDGEVPADAAVREEASGMDAPPALDALCRLFGLSPFERKLILLCTGPELDSSFAELFPRSRADSFGTAPTMSLALAAFPGAHWSALTPNGPLRYWSLIEVGSGNTLTASPLRINERILHYLVGVRHLDQRLVSMVEPLHDDGELVPSHRQVAGRLQQLWAQKEAVEPVQLCGAGADAKRSIAATVCRERGTQPYLMYAEAIPTAPAEVESIARLWTRDAALDGLALVLDCEDVDAADAPRVQAVTSFIERVKGPLIVLSRDRWPIRRRALVALDVRRPSHDEQNAIWRDELGPAGASLNGKMDELVAQFDVSAETIRMASREALSSTSDGEDIGDLAWEACRVQARSRLDDLAQHIEATAGWDDLVLPESQLQILREIVAQVRERVIVYDRWGFRGKGDRGLGITVLFAGQSGTGKTTAAEVLARDLRLDLYRIDLSSLVSKYIGETEKNLRRVFDAAEEGGAVLLFDEADALFGKRSEVKDSHDRYANIEVSYLLQRMETYRGLAILTTNMRKALDTAFLRRLRFVVHFPFPDAAQRAEIWERIFPPATPRESLDTQKLAQLSVSGGNIRNIALHAAFLAASAREPVRMEHVLHAAEREYAKLEKVLTGSETAGWLSAGEEMEMR